MIASIARSQGASVVTHDTGGFEGCGLSNQSLDGRISGPAKASAKRLNQGRMKYPDAAGMLVFRAPGCRTRRANPKRNQEPEADLGCYAPFRHRRSASSQAASGCRSGTHASPVLASDDTASGVTTTSSSAGRLASARSIAGRS